MQYKQWRRLTTFRNVKGEPGVPVH